MQATAPVNGDISRLFVQLDGTGWRTRISTRLQQPKLKMSYSCGITLQDFISPSQFIRVVLWTNTTYRTYQLIHLLTADRTHRDHQTQGNLLLHWLQKDMNYGNKRTDIFNDKTWCLHRAATTLSTKSKAYSAAFVCCTQTCCRVEYCVETLCNRHCEILSFLLVWPCAVSETTLAFSFKRLKFFICITLSLYYINKPKKVIYYVFWLT